MSELPGRPNLDQLRRQARELFRAAADGEAPALTRIRAVAEQISLSAAQLAVAREYGFTSWPALRAEVVRRLADSPLEKRTRRAETRWSFGGGATIETAAGVLCPGVLVAGPDHAALDASLVPSEESQHQRAASPRQNFRESQADATGGFTKPLDEAVIGAVALTDDQGTAYTLHVEALWRSSLCQGQERGLTSLRLGVDPVPARERKWVELRGQAGSAARLLPSERREARVSGLTPVSSGSPARELSKQAVMLIGLQLTGADQSAMERYCSMALARLAQIQQSGEPGAAGDLPGHLARLCALLTRRGPADGLPREWSSILDAAKRTDGPQQHLDISAVMPPVDGIAVLIDSLVSEPRSWSVYLRADPSWWTRSSDQRHKSAVVSVHAKDDLGGMYLSQFGGSSGHGSHEEVTLIFRPRLNPLARAVTLTFSGTAEQVSLELLLPGHSQAS